MGSINSPAEIVDDVMSCLDEEIAKKNAKYFAQASECATSGSAISQLLSSRVAKEDCADQNVATKHANATDDRAWKREQRKVLRERKRSKIASKEEKQKARTDNKDTEKNIREAEREMNSGKKRESKRKLSLLSASGKETEKQSSAPVLHKAWWLKLAPKTPAQKQCSASEISAVKTRVINAEASLTGSSSEKQQDNIVKKTLKRMRSQSRQPVNSTGDPKTSGEYFRPSTAPVSNPISKANISSKYSYKNLTISLKTPQNSSKGSAKACSSPKSSEAADSRAVESVSARSLNASTLTVSGSEKSAGCSNSTALLNNSKTGESIVAKGAELDKEIGLREESIQRAIDAILPDQDSKQEEGEENSLLVADLVQVSEEQCEENLQQATSAMLSECPVHHTGHYWCYAAKAKRVPIKMLNLRGSRWSRDGRKDDSDSDDEDLCPGGRVKGLDWTDATPLSSGVFSKVTRVSYKEQRAVVKLQSYKSTMTHSELKQLIRNKQKPHPNIMPLIAHCATRSYVMTIFPCGACNLEQLVSHHTGLPHTVIPLVIKSLYAALHHLHRQKIAYRNLMASNVIMMEDGTPMIADFVNAGKFSWRTLKCTREAGIVSCMEYASPEEVWSGTSGPATDMWCLGVVMCKAIKNMYPQDFIRLLYNLKPSDLGYAETSIRRFVDLHLPELYETSMEENAILEACFNFDAKQRVTDIQTVMISETVFRTVSLREINAGQYTAAHGEIRALIDQFLSQQATKEKRESNLESRQELRRVGLQPIMTHTN